MSKNGAESARECRLPSSSGLLTPLACKLLHIVSSSISSSSFPLFLFTAIASAIIAITVIFDIDSHLVDEDELATPPPSFPFATLVTTNLF